MFNPLENSGIIYEKILNKRTIKKLLSEILLIDRQKNENRIEQFTEKKRYTTGVKVVELGIPDSESLFTRNCWFEQVLFDIC